MPDAKDWIEADIVINGTRLTFGQSMTVRVALETFAMTTNSTKAELGPIADAYLQRIEEIRAALYWGQDVRPGVVVAIKGE